MNPRGHRAALPAADHRRPEYVSPSGLVVHHHNRQGFVKDYDFTTFPVAEPMQRSLAALFAARCVPHLWAAHSTSSTYWYSLGAFADFVSKQPHHPRDLDDLTVGVMKGWRLQSRGSSFRAVGSLLGGDSRMQSGPVAEELKRRVSTPKSDGTQSFSEAEFETITRIAKKDFRLAERRIEANAAHLQRWRDGRCVKNTPEWDLGECLDVLATTGTLPRYEGIRGEKSLFKRYRSALRGLDSYTTWYSLLFLTRREATSLAVLLMSEHGWNMSIIDGLEVPLTSPDPGKDGNPTYRIPLKKPRRGSSGHFETRNITDDGAASQGRLITRAIHTTRFAREIVETTNPGTNRLIIWRGAQPKPVRESDNRDRQSRVEPFGLGLSEHSGTKWGRYYGIGGSPFRRGRRTVVALNRREPSQHSSTTHDRAYVLLDKRVQAEAIDTIAQGAQDAVEGARQVILIAELRDDPSPHDAETATADCKNFDDSPYPGPDGRCSASFLMCLGCTNARIHPGHHARLAHLHHALANLRSVMPSNSWEADWGQAYARLEALKSSLGQGVWTHAKARASDDDRRLIDLLLGGNFDK